MKRALLAGARFRFGQNAAGRLEEGATAWIWPLEGAICTGGRHARPPILLYRRRPRPYGPRRFNRPFQAATNMKKQAPMRAETQNIVDEIRQAISLLRRHL
ncbi:hypothetical protein [Mesorhizobium sp. ANAO-SY3R2]|uniref:hypothetical protein n=1 Tax=Mesorhizobium sp. ANAO-SY3R2 TaxID=3166644 RepID=UPI00366C93E3